MAKLILLRHGQSVLNQHNVFTGCIDIPLTEKGVEECLKAGKQIAHVPIDIIFSSTLIRAQMSAMLVMSVHKEEKIPYIVHTGQKKLEEWSQNYAPTQKNTFRCIPPGSSMKECMGNCKGLTNKR
ncbi:MAG: histidine phosphatase family protein [Rhabdochlamydiaceae bacterium]|jgi:2,3-bisphosphoglycerate-dependent phosphoglycerate mutase